MFNQDKLKVALRSNIKQTELLNELYRLIKQEYSDADKVFTPASPYGQILEILTAFNENWTFYLEDIANEGNLATALRQESIFGLAQLVGHNPTRSIAANGILTLRTKIPDEEIRGRFVTITNGTRLRCENNNLEYFLEVDSATDTTQMDILSNDGVDFRMIQGTIETQTIVGTGEELQSYSISSLRAIDNDRVSVSVNNERWQKVFSLYDMTDGGKQFFIQTNITGGVDVIFGNNGFGSIPGEGARIDIEYVVSDGLSGNIEISPEISFQFLDETQTEFDEEIDLNEVFDITLKTGILLGSDPEDTEFTKRIAPYNSRGFVLINPNNYKNFLSRFNFLSIIEAWNTKNDTNFDDDNIVYLFLLPDITKFLDRPTDYFNLSESDFLLSNELKSAISEYILRSGRQATTSELRFVDGVIRRYVCNVYIRIFENSDQFKLLNDIRNEIANYFITNKRRDRIPKSDLIRIIEDVEGVDSVNVNFISQRNEEAITQGFYLQPTRRFNGSIENVRVNLNEGEDPGLGLDDFGDIEIEDDEVIILRGGWNDRNGTFYNPGIHPSGFGSLNIFITSRIPLQTN